MNSNISQDQKISKIDSVIALKEKKTNDSLHIYYQDYAYWLYDIDKKEHAIKYEKQAFSFAHSKSKKDSLFLQKSLFYQGFYYRHNNQVLKSIESLNEAIFFGEKTKYSASIYEGLGIGYKRIHDYHKTLLHYELAISLFKEKNKKSKKLRKLYYNTALVCIDLKTTSSFQKAIKYAKSADSIATQIPTSHTFRIEIKNLLASCYNQFQNLDINTALKYFSEALTIAKENKDTLNISKIYKKIGNLYNTTNQEISLKYLNKALNYTSSTDSIQLVKLYYNFLLTNSYRKSYETGIEFGHKSLAYLIKDNLKEHKRINRDLFIKSNQKALLLLLISNLAESYLKHYEGTKDNLMLEKSIAYFKLADFIVDLMKMHSSEFKSQLFWREMSTDIYGKAIKACYLGDNIDAAYYFMEKNKALLLMEVIATKNYKQSLEVAPHLLAKENELKRKLLLLDNALKKDNLPDKTSDSNNKVKIDLNRNLLRFQDSIYPDKHTLEEPEIRTLSVTKQQIENDEVLVEYHISIDDGYGIYSNNENAYVLFITNKSEYFFEIPNQSILKKEVTQLNNLLKKPFTTENDIITYQKVAHEVYKSLFPTAEIRELIKNKKLRIIADSYLSVLPFESLITTENTSNYLIEDSNISYLYSYSFLRHNTYTSDKKTSFLGFAPVSFDYDDLATLSHTRDEIDYLSDYYTGSSFLQQEATKDNFLSELSQHNLIHLATHADAQDSISPWIAFSDKKISLEELYLTNSNASLVVLSGCNTSLGKQEVGEGIMSLARGFFYSGTQSVISSLWSIDDTSTSYIINEFYKNLQNGQSKSESLRNAKLTYLNSHSLSEASPHYWASLILLGEDDILLNATTHWGIFASILFILCLIAFFFFRKKRTTA